MCLASPSPPAPNLKWPFYWGPLVFVRVWVVAAHQISFGADWMAHKLRGPL